jgi:hypothetical protein
LVPCPYGRPFDAAERSHRFSYPGGEYKLLIGDDGVDRWSEQWIWDDALRGVRIVVSTHAVLADALAHRFVAMAKLALIVFDEGKDNGFLFSTLG